jgi:hypothetical protein
MGGRLKSNLITTGIVLIMLVMLLVVFLLFPFRSRDAVQISFLGYTNDLSGIRFAVFVVTNTSNEQISYAQFTPQIKIFDTWETPHCTHIPIPIPPHGTDNYLIPAVTNAAIWRSLALWRSDAGTPLEVWRNKLVGNITWNWRELLRGQWPRYYAVSGERYYQAFSAAITNK